MISVLQLFSFSPPYFSLSPPIFFPTHYDTSASLSTSTCSSLCQSLINMKECDRSWSPSSRINLLHLSSSPPMRKKRDFLFNLSSASLYHVGHTSSTSPIGMPAASVPLSFVPSHITPPSFTDHHTIFPLFIPALCPIPLLLTP